MRKMKHPQEINPEKMTENLYDSEIKVMEILWDNGPTSAKELSDRLKVSTDWSINTSYTVTRKLVSKGFIERREPGFICVPAVSREDEQKKEIRHLLQKLFKGSRAGLVSALLSDEELTEEERNEIRSLLK